MTIIACSKSEGVMGADTLVVDTAEFTRVGHLSKIVKCVDGALAGACGDSPTCVEFLNWAKAGRKGKPKRRWFKRTTGLVLTKDHRILAYEGQYPDELDDDFCAIGCGATAARGRRVSGASVLECVEAAIQISLGCGGKPQILKLGKAKRRRCVV